MSRRFVMVVMLACAVVPRVAAQRQSLTGPLAIALSAERRGDFRQAIEYFTIWLGEHPGDPQAVLGLSRVLPALDRRAELLPPLRRALAIDSTNRAFLALAVRTHALLGQVDSTRAWVERWARLAEGEEEPYREWAQSALEARDRAAAKEALETGRRRIAHPAALAPELAQFRQSEGDYAGAASEWIRAMGNVAGFRASALLLLGDLAPPHRDVVLRTLEGSAVPEATQLRALLLLKWGRPEDGVALLATAMPADFESAVMVLRAVFDELKGRSDRTALRAKARALELQASVESGASRVRSWMEAARAWADAGEEREARRLLGQVAADPAAPSGVATAASSALLGVLIAEGRPADAESVLVTLRTHQSMDERDRDARRVALAWARAGNIARGEALLDPDSSVAGFSARGVLRAYAGDLKVAAVWLELAGPYDDERIQAVERVRLLTLLKAVARDSLPPLGQALLLLERGDTAAAVPSFAAVAALLDPPGAAAVRLFAGELSLAHRDTTAAVVLLRAADVVEAPASAPAARFSHAQVLAARGETTAAQELLEAIILDFPASAVVPAARRFRDALRGAVPSGAGR